ncbi:MAG: aminotransferase class III-fold pyridoxal phosphate-dependent enzyme, partial [Gammaproteobacteria bacterium]|nr:aminotransferase class III-fold pyridoxal phosphate-dependent enzyme [Gammaproteobacteria bacterium]
SEKLAQLMPPLSKVFYASDGACAVEIALKMSLHARYIQGDRERHQFVALQNAYHGDTVGAVSVSDIGLYRHPYEPLLFPCHFISPPYVSGRTDTAWMDCHAQWNIIENELQSMSKKISAIIVEPIVQGAGGMKIYSQDFLRRLRAWTHQHNIHLIVDEIMTGIGRTGKMFACEHANIQPDFLCLSKGLTSGWLPLSTVLTHSAIYDVFYSDGMQNAFLHSHTYSGNALAASVALETLNIIEEEQLCDRANFLEKLMLTHMQTIAANTNKLFNVRAMGAIVAADLACEDPNSRIGFAIYQEAIRRGVFLRPLGNTIYWLPPLNVKVNTLNQLKERTEQAIMAVPF